MISDVGRLKSGDHICHPTQAGFGEHHAIVVCVMDAAAYKGLLIEVTNDGGASSSGSPGSSTSSATVVQHTCSLKEHVEARNLFRYNYAEEDCLPAEQVLQRATSWVGKKIKYDLLMNNCEHFARWCKTGKAESEQIRKYLSGSDPQWFSSSSNSCRSSGSSGCKTS
jgi:hypothetical protein